MTRGFLEDVGVHSYAHQLSSAWYCDLTEEKAMLFITPWESQEARSWNEVFDPFLFNLVLPLQTRTPSVIMELTEASDDSKAPATSPVLLIKCLVSSHVRVYSLVS